MASDAADAALALSLQHEEWAQALADAAAGGLGGGGYPSSSSSSSSAVLILDDEDDEEKVGAATSSASSSSSIIRLPMLLPPSHDPSEWSLPPHHRGGGPSGLLPLASVVGRAADLSDPTPSVHALFVDFNERFFHGRLATVAVSWSKRMTLCAGLCSYEGKGGLCSIRLSQPLLTLRPRSDLVSTLLHEMVHAWEFVARRVRDHDGHGPEFLRIADGINRACAAAAGGGGGGDRGGAAASSSSSSSSSSGPPGGGGSGVNITVYHTFHDEVDEQRKHVWRCTGKCRETPPYFGLVKRANNRAPQPADWWWGKHQAECGGVYEKISEPAAAAAEGAAGAGGSSAAAAESKGEGSKRRREEANKAAAHGSTRLDVLFGAGAGKAAKKGKGGGGAAVIDLTGEGEEEGEVVEIPDEEEASKSAAADAAAAAAAAGEDDGEDDVVIFSPG
jgi:hypothetical protein